MKYEHARSRIRSGDLLAWSHVSWRTWRDIKIQLVRIFTQSEICHVGTAWVPPGDRVFVLEAVTPLVRNFPLSKLLPFYWIPLEAPWSKEAEEFALDKIGDPYSEGQAVAAFLGRLRIDADRAWECAEYSHAIAGRDGIDLGKRAVPTDLVREAMRRPGVAKIYVEA